MSRRNRLGWPRRRALWAMVALGAVAGSLGGWSGVGVADATTITVTTSDDTIANDGLCSLREAVIAANTNADTSGCPAGTGDGVDTVVLGPQTYRLAITGAEASPSAAVNDLDVTDGLTLKGAGAAMTTIDAGGIDRALDNLSALRVEGITFTDGRPRGSLDGPDGGAIRSTGTGTLQIVDSAFLNNRAANAAAGAPQTGADGSDAGPPGSGTGGPGAEGGNGGAISSSTPVTVSGSRFEQNAAGTGGSGGFGTGGMGGQSSTQANDNGGSGTGGPGTAGGSGGAIYSTGGAMIAGSSFVSNHAGDGGAGGPGTGGGGGLYLRADNPGFDLVGTGGQGTGGDGGQGGRGGALLIDGGPSQVTASTFTANLSGAGGGGGSGSGGSGGEDLNLPGPGGDGSGGFGGPSGAAGAIEAASKLDLSASTLSGNRTGPGGDGGAGTGGAGTRPLNSANYGRSGRGSGGSGFSAAKGAAIQLQADGTLTNDTIVGNTAGDGGAGGTGAPNAAGVPQPSKGGGGGSGGSGAVDANGATILVSLRNDTIASNVFGSGGAGANGSGRGSSGSSSALRRTAGSFAVAADVFFGNEAPGCASSSVAGTIGDSGGNVRAPAGDSSCPGSPGDAGLGQLQDNGGPVATQAPSGGGAAVDAAGGTQCPATDARGAARPFGPACDAGAYELTPPSASTGAARNINATGATLTADVNAQGPAGSVAFEYGSSASYGARTTARPLDSGFATGSVSADVSGVAAGTIVHYRVVVTTHDGTALGADATFTAGAAGSSTGGGSGSRSPSSTGGGRSPSSTGSPQLSHVSLTQRRFAVAPQPTAVSAGLAAVSARAGVPLGTSFQLRLSAASSVTFSITRKSAGRSVRAHGRTACVAPGHRRVSSRARCTRYVPSGALRRALRSGSATVGFSGRVGRRALALGDYRVTIRASRNGHVSRATVLSFTIVRAG